MSNVRRFMHPVTQRFTIFADNFQIVLMDERSNYDFAAIWTEEALLNMLAVGQSAVCPGTLRNVEVQVEVGIAETEPAVSLDAYDHAVEASIHLPSGQLVVMGCTGYLPEADPIEVDPVLYRVLVLASGTDCIQTEWEPANDLYTVYLWPGLARKPKLLKHWRPSA